MGRIIILILLVPFLSVCAFGGPPFLTDDPEPVDFRHWEFYIASTQTITKTETDATFPHFEINYGAIPEIQLHLIIPFTYNSANASRTYGFGTSEFGVKYRFIDETDSSPQIGTFPLVEIPTESHALASGDENVQVFLPIWIQKSYGNFSTYGGGGCWINPGVGNRNWIFLGWQAQYNFSNSLTAGGEIFYQTADAVDGTSSLGMNIGGFVNLSEENHILLSIGHSLTGSGTMIGYVAYQLTL